MYPRSTLSLSDPDTPLPGALAEVERQIGPSRRTQVPSHPDLPSGALTRLLYRRALRRTATWFSLIRLRPPLDPLPIAEIAERSARAWLALAAGAGHEALALAAERAGAAVLLETDAPVALDPQTLRSIRAADPLHGVAVDPALAPLREALLAHTRGGALVHLAGAPGTGKRSLAHWVHHERGLDGLVELQRGSATRPNPGAWLLVNELGELDAGTAALVEERLALWEEGPPRTLAEAPPRPADRAFDELVGESYATRQLLALASTVAASPHPVLILGESGTGKEVLARAIHAASRRTGPFVPVDLSAVPEELVESELFGHVRGAFSGAERSRLGTFRSAEGGTLLIDELGNLRPSVQARLLRVLQERRVRPVGSDSSEPVNVRVIAATNAPLDAMVAAGRFREDLLMRLNTFVLRIPPLRERPDDIGRIAEAVFARERGLRSAPPGWISPAATRRLVAWRWPGNVRELEAVIRRAATLTPPGQPIDTPQLGLPDARGPAPLISTHSGPPVEDPRALGLSRQSWHALTAITLRTPLVRDRSPRDLRALVESMLEGRFIDAEAMALLTEQPWWGNLTELQAALSALAASPPGPLTAARVRATLPMLRGLSGHRPIRVLLSPTLDRDGQIRGLHETYEVGALLVGRLRGPADLARVSQESAQRLAPLLAAIGGRALGFLDLSLVPRLSRVHAAILRGRDGLEVHTVAGIGLPLWAGRLEAGTPPREVLPLAPVAVGEAGELIIRERTGAVALHLFVFEGATAYEEHAAQAAARLTGAMIGPTLHAGGEEPAEAAEGRPRWILEPAEVLALAGLLTRFPGGVFKSWLSAEIAAWRADPQLNRLAAYLQSAPNPGDYAGRLLETEGNEPAIDALAQAVARAPDPAALLERLPARLRRLAQR